MSANGWRGTSEIQDPSYYYATDPTTVFNGAIAVGAIINVDLLVFPVPSVLITNVVLVSSVALPYSLYFWGDNTYNAGGVACTQNLMMRLNYDVTMATLIGGAAPYYYSFSGIPGLQQLAPNPFPFPYYTLGAAGHLYMGLSVNGGAVAKNAGQLVGVKLFYQPAGE